MFELKNVCYKDILNIENLTIDKNKITCIVGHSGSGKTTLLRLLNRLISHDSGEINLLNQSIDQINPIDLRRKVVMLPQNPAIFPGDIKHNLLIGLRYSEKPLQNDQQLNEVLKLIHLNKRLEDNTDKLSGGEKQRIALGRVILMDPEVLLLDEPSSALDEVTEHKVIEAIVDYAKTNHKTLIMVTHSKKVANEFSEVIIELEKGMVVGRKEVLSCLE